MATCCKNCPHQCPALPACARPHQCLSFIANKIISANCFYNLAFPRLLQRFLMDYLSCVFFTFPLLLQIRSYQHAASSTFLVVCLLCKIFANYTICRSFCKWVSLSFLIWLTLIQYLVMETQLDKISCLMLWPWNFETLKLGNFEIFFFVFANSRLNCVPPKGTDWTECFKIKLFFATLR